MKRATMDTTGRPRGDYKINRPFNTVPAITSEFTEGGTRYYLTGTGATYDADMYDRTFKVNPVKPLKRGYKGRPASVDAAGLPINKSIRRYSNGPK